MFNASVRVRTVAFWQVLVFLLEAAVFILIGFSLPGVLERVGEFGVVVEAMSAPVLPIVVAVLASRFLWGSGRTV